MPKKSIRLIKFGEECLYVGSPQSLALLRIYNKKLERGFDESDEECPHWWRCEFQLRDEHAMQIVREWSECGSVGSVFAGHVKNILDSLILLMAVMVIRTNMSPLNGGIISLAVLMSSSGLLGKVLNTIYLNYRSMLSVMLVAL